jgi:hypothetical protein
MCAYPTCQVGELQRQVSMVSRKPEDEFWSEESGRRWVPTTVQRKGRSRTACGVA